MRTGFVDIMSSLLTTTTLIFEFKICMPYLNLFEALDKQDFFSKVAVACQSLFHTLKMLHLIFPINTTTHMGGAGTAVVSTSGNYEGLC